MRRGWQRALLLASATLAGCHVDTHGDGEQKRVHIDTPFGDMHVTTNRAAAMEQIGLDAYPGAQPALSANGNDAADVDLGFGRFQLRVKAASFRTADPPPKVQAFYLPQMQRYGDVVTCRQNHPVGLPTQTRDGLGCEQDNGGRHISIDDHTDPNEVELRTGSRRHMRIVEIEPDGAGAKFKLVLLDLPGGDRSED